MLKAPIPVTSHKAEVYYLAQNSIVKLLDHTDINKYWLYVDSWLAWRSEASRVWSQGWWLAGEGFLSVSI